MLESLEKKDSQKRSGFPQAIKKYWIVKSVFKTLKKYWIWPKCPKGIEKYGNSKFSHLFIKI